MLGSSAWGSARSDTDGKIIDEEVGTNIHTINFGRAFLCIAPLGHSSGGHSERQQMAADLKEVHSCLHIDGLELGMSILI